MPFLIDLINQGAWILEEMSDLTSDVKQLNKKYKDALKEIKNEDKAKVNITREEFILRDEITENWTTINSMLKDGLVFKEDNVLVINQTMRTTLEKFIFFLKKKKEF